MTTPDNRHKRPWSNPTRPFSVRLTDTEARILKRLVRTLRMSQSKVLAKALVQFDKSHDK